jgi:hypothetical protein
MLRRTAIFGLPAALAGCTTAKNISDGADTPQNEGILVMQVSGTQEGFLNFNVHGESTFGTRFAENMVGPKGTIRFGTEEQLIVRSVEAGDYMWTKLLLLKSNQFAWLSRSTKFKVAKGSITYLGHLRITIIGDRYGVRVFDRETDARNLMAAQYPKYLSSFPFQKELAEVRIGA